MSEIVRKARLKDVWVQVSRLAEMPGMDKEEAEDLMRGYIQAEFGQQSTRQLTPGQLKQTADWLRAKVQRPSRPQSPSGSTAKQQAAIKKMAKTLKLNQEQLAAYAERILGVKQPRTPQEASVFYQALDALQLHRRRNDALLPQQQIAFCLSHLDRLDAWKSDFIQSLAKKLQKDRSLTGRMRAKLDEAYRAAGGHYDLPSEGPSSPLSPSRP